MKAAEWHALSAAAALRRRPSAAQVTILNVQVPPSMRHYGKYVWMPDLTLRTHWHTESSQFFIKASNYLIHALPGGGFVQSAATLKSTSNCRKELFRLTCESI